MVVSLTRKTNTSMVLIPSTNMVIRPESTFVRLDLSDDNSIGPLPVYLKRWGPRR